jgi:hypothetical protein
MEWLELIFDFIKKTARFLWFGHNGYVAHFIVGILLSALVSIFSLNRSNNKIQSVMLGFLFATLIGLLKEIVDPYIGRHRAVIDLLFTSFGALLGSFSVFSDRLLHFYYPIEYPANRRIDFTIRSM